MTTGSQSLTARRFAQFGPEPGTRLIQSREIRFSEILSAFSVALDITQGHPQGHCMRTAMIGMRLADELALSTAESTALFYALLLKDLGCSSNAAKIAYLFGADDQHVKRSIRMIDWTSPGQCLTNCWRQSAPGGTFVGKLKALAAIARMGAAGARQITEIRCQRGAGIARMLQLPEATAEAIMDLDEHWNGRGGPRGAKKEEASLLGRICCLAQTVEVFLSAYGLKAALDVARERRGVWFDPRLVDVLEAIQGEAEFWRRVIEADPLVELRRWEPEDSILLADEACLDRVAEAFAMVVDSKSPWTYLHSTRVAEVAVGIARQFTCPAELERDLRRAALLHDVGKLGVSNTILDKAGRPTDEEFVEIRKHPDFSQQILSRVAAFHDLADCAGAHHERLDGQGYHRQLNEVRLPWVTRVLTVADVYEAMSAKRPYRDAMTWEQIDGILRRDAGRGVDPECLDALRRWVEQGQLESRVDQQLEQVERAMTAL